MPKTPEEQLVDGLAAARELVAEGKEPELKISAEFIRAYAGWTIAEVREQLAEAKEAFATSVVRIGFAYMALKLKLRGRFKKTLIEEEGQKGYYAAWRAMCRAQAFLLLPEVAEHLGIRGVMEIIAMSPDELRAIRAKLIGVSAEVAKAITEKALEERDDYRKIEKDLRAAGRRKPPKTYPDLTDDDLPTALDSLVMQALSALNLIGVYKISPKEHARAARSRQQIQFAWQQAAYNLSDPEHKNLPWWEMNPMHDDISEPDAD